MNLASCVYKSISISAGFHLPLNERQVPRLSAAYFAGECSFEVKIEPDSNDITEQSHHDNPTITSRG